MKNHFQYFFNCCLSFTTFSFLFSPFYAMKQLLRFIYFIQLFFGYLFITPKSTHASKRTARVLDLSDSDSEAPGVTGTPSTSQQAPSKTPASKKRRINPKRNPLLWQHFTELDLHTVRCDVCQAKVPRKDSSTSGMRSHLQRHHGALFAAFLEQTGSKLEERVM